MSISKEALEFLIREGEMKDPIIDLGGQGTYSTTRLERIITPKAATLTVSTLTGLVDYVKNNIDELEGKLLIQVKSPREVALYSQLNVDQERFLDTERFNIMLQSSFVENKDKDALLKYTGLITDDTVKSFGDDGVSQQVTVKTGVASVSQAVVPNPVTLAPFRTFPEIEQPESKFIFRMKEGPSAALFEADGGAWRNKAILGIKEYLQKELEHNHNIEIIA